MVGGVPGGVAGGTPGGVLGGRKIDLVIEDDSGTPEKGVAGLRKLASQDKVTAVIGQFHSSVMEAVQDLAEQLKIPVFSTQASAKGITEKHLTYTFRTHVIDPVRVTQSALINAASVSGLTSLEAWFMSSTFTSTRFFV